MTSAVSPPRGSLPTTSTRSPGSRRVAAAGSKTRTVVSTVPGSKPVSSSACTSRTSVSGSPARTGAARLRPYGGSDGSSAPSGTSAGSTWTTATSDGSNTSPARRSTAAVTTAWVSDGAGRAAWTAATTARAARIAASGRRRARRVRRNSRRKVWTRVLLMPGTVGARRRRGRLSTAPDTDGLGFCAVETRATRPSLTTSAQISSEARPGRSDQVEEPAFAASLDPEPLVLLELLEPLEPLELLEPESPVFFLEDEFESESLDDVDLAPSPPFWLARLSLR